MANTPNLNIPLIDRTQPLLSRQFNDALEEIDKNALAKAHEKNPMHWPMWQSGTAYKKADIFRTEGIPSWGYWEVTTAGTSGTSTPVGYGEGDTFLDGTCQLVLRRLTKPDGVTELEVKKLIKDAAPPEERLWVAFKKNKAYVVGDVFRTPTTPSWGYWEVTTGGTAGTDVPNSTNLGDVATTGTVKAVLRRIGKVEDTRTIVFATARYSIQYPYEGTVKKITILSANELGLSVDFEVEAKNPSTSATRILGKYTIPSTATFTEIPVNLSLSKDEIVRIKASSDRLDNTVFQLYVENV